MNFVKKLFHQHQRQRSSNGRSHSAAAGSTDTSTSMVGASGSSVTSLTEGHSVVVSKSRTTKPPRDTQHQRQKKSGVDGEQDRADDNGHRNEVDADGDCTDDEPNGNGCWQSSPNSSPGKSPNRRRGRRSNARPDRVDVLPAESPNNVVTGCTASPAVTPTRSTTTTACVSLRSESATTPTEVVTREIRMLSSRHVAQVLPNLLLGSQEIANDLRGLRHYNVTHVLNVTHEVPDRFPGQFIYKRIAISDMPSAKLLLHFDEAFRFIDEARASPAGCGSGGCVLVHCYYGNSRSASLVIGYLMLAERMRYVDALHYLQLLRPGVRPNDGFQRQLKHYELTTVTRDRQHSAVAVAAAAAACAAAALTGPTSAAVADTAGNGR